MVDLLQLGTCRKTDAAQGILVLALRHLLLEIGGQGITLMPQIGIGQVGAPRQLFASIEQTLTDFLDLRHEPLRSGETARWHGLRRLAIAGSTYTSPC